MQVQTRKWIWYLLPSQITAQGLGTVIPLYVIFLGGGISEVAIVSTLQNAAVAIGSIAWGKIIDRFHAKRLILVVSFFFVLLCSVGLYFTKSIYMVYVIAPILGFFLVAKNPVTNLLVMESVQKNLWSWLFARTSVISTLGMLVAMVIGTVGSLYFDLKPYFLICAVSSGAAMILSMAVKGGVIHIERSSIAHSLHGLRYVIHHHVFVFPKVPELHDFKHITTIFRGRISNEIGIFYLAFFCFYFGSNMYFTAWTPFLKSNGFSNSAVFLNYMIQMATMLGVFFIAPKIISRLGEQRSTMIAYFPRITAVLIPAVSVPIMSTNVLGVPLAIASSCLMVIAFSIFSTSSSVIFFKSIPQGFEGKYLGVNSAVTGVSVFAGSLVTGELTRLLGYTVMFLSATIAIGISLILFQVYFRYRLSHTT